ncbi:MAG: hypothetical protein WCV69_02245 [Patescibacteria group bacterium]|jgi:hypothetical protein
MKRELPERFNYTSVIKQKILAEICPVISVEEALILDYLIGMCTSENEKIDAQRVDGYTWVNYEKIITDNPLLRAKTKGPITTKIKKLEGYGFIETKNIRFYGLPRKFIRLTELSEELVDKGANSSYYRAFLSIGVNEPQAIEMASDKKFLTNKAWSILRTIKTRDVPDAASYLYNTYQVWLEEDR